MTETRIPEEQALLDLANPPQTLEAPADQITVTPAELAPPVTLTFEYQPKDESGRPIGGKQVIKYTDPTELPNLLAAQNELLIRKLREETRKNRLGIQDNEEIDDAAPKFEAPLEFKPKVLTQEDRYRIGREISDPDTFDKAADELLEARLGAKPEVLGKTITELQLESSRNKAVAEAEAFMRATPDFVKCDENGKAITSWIARYGLAPVKANYEKAYAALKQAGVLILVGDVEAPAPTQVSAPVIETPVETPILETPVTPVETPVIETPVVEVPAKATPSRIPTGLTRGQSTDVGNPRPTGEDIVYEIVTPAGKKRFVGAAALNAMPSDEYKHRLLHEPGFRDKAEKVEQAESARRKFVRR